MFVTASAESSACNLLFIFCATEHFAHVAHSADLAFMSCHTFSMPGSSSKNNKVVAYLWDSAFVDGILLKQFLFDARVLAVLTVPVAGLTVTEN